MKVDFKKNFIIIIFILILIIVIYSVKRGGLLKKTNTEPATPVTEQTVPCKGKPLTKIEFGRLYGVNHPSAEFTTTGGDIYIVARNTERSGVFDLGNSTDISIGFADQQPKWNDPADVKAKTIINISAIKDKFNKVSLTQGRYWFWTSRGADIDLISCNPNGVSDPLPR